MITQVGQFSFFERQRKSFVYRLSILILGFVFDGPQHAFGMRNGWDGIEYYAEVHQSRWNSYIHSIFMLGTMYGHFIWIPALFNMSNSQALIVRSNVCIFYLGLYLGISPSIAIMTAVYYLIPFILATGHYINLKSQAPRFYYGILIATVSLIIQEVFGHYLGGDSSSRLEAVPNAILYAPFYSVSHIF